MNILFEVLIAIGVSFFLVAVFGFLFRKDERKYIYCAAGCGELCHHKDLHGGFCRNCALTFYNYKK